MKLSKWIKPSFIALSVLTISACGEGGNDGHNHDDGAIDIPEHISAYSGQDWSKTITATETQDGVVTGDFLIGNPDAPVLIEEYASLTCGHCANFHINMLPTVKESYIKAGVARLQLKNLVRDGSDVAAAKLARCMGPDKGYVMLDTLFTNQQFWAGQNAAKLVDYAREAGMSRAAFDRCQSNGTLQQNLMETLKEADSRGVTGTPTFFINGEKIDFHGLSDLMNALKMTQ